MSAQARPPSPGQAFAIQALIARFDPRFDSAKNLKIRFNSIFQKILVDFFRFDFWLQLLESHYYNLQIRIESNFLAQFV